MVRDDASGQLLLKQMGGEANIEAVSRFEQNVKKLILGRVDLIAYGEHTALSVIAKMGYSRNRFKVVHVLGEEQACFAFHRDTPDALIHRFQQSLDKITASPDYPKLLDQYSFQPSRMD